jgi:hypothetical protein
MGDRKNKGKVELRTNVSYKAAAEAKIVHQVVYEWLKTTKCSLRALGRILESWRSGHLFLMVDFRNLKTKPKKPEYDLFLRKYVSKYLGVKNG